MIELARRADDWMFEPAPPARPATFRILVGSFAVGYLCVRFRPFASLTDNAPSRFGPVGALSWMTQPFSDWMWIALIISAIVVGIAFTVGLLFKATGPVFALMLLALTTYRSSWGQLLHFENLLVLHALIIGFTHSADALSFDSRRKRASVDASPASLPAIHYGWPVRLAAIVTVLTYLLAGIAKLRYGGSEWVLGDSLRHHIAYSAVRLDLLGGASSPLAAPLVGQAWVFPPLAIITVALEVGAPIALVGGRIRNLWVGGAWLLHAGIAASMFVVFPYPLFLVAFAPLFEIERISNRSRSFRRNRKPAEASTALPGR